MPSAKLHVYGGSGYFDPNSATITGLTVKGDQSAITHISSAMTFDRNGNVGIGTTAPAYTLDVNGNIRAVGSIYYGGTAGSANGALYSKPDYVFEPGYHALTTEEVEAFLKKEKHLPWLTSAKQEKEENSQAVNMTRMGFQTVETAENLQIQIIRLNEVIKILKAEKDAEIVTKTVEIKELKTAYDSLKQEITELKLLLAK